MADGNLLEWNLFKNNPEILKNYTKVHVFNWGRSAFLIKHDKLYAYGENNPCFNGLGLFEGLLKNTPNELQFLDHNGVQEIATGLEHAVLLDCNDIVYCWGNNDHGQLGTGNTHSSVSYKEQNLPPIKHISCGQFFTLALSYENEIWFWGRQFNVSRKGKIRAVPTVIKLPDHVYVKSITAGCGDAAILDTNGTVYAWGFNGCGQLGLGHREIVHEPKPVRFIDNCKLVIIARNRTAFITESGQFYIGGTYILDDDFECRQIYCPGNIVSIAASWCKDLFVIENDKGEIWKWVNDDPAAVTTKTRCKKIIEVFKDLWTPSIQPDHDRSNNNPGIIGHMPLPFFNLNIDTVEERRAAQGVNQIKLPSNISKIDSSHSKSDGYMNVSGHFNEEICSDITIKLSDESIHAHKLVLYVKSKYFKSLIEKSSKDMTMLDMSNWTSRSYRAYIKYLYTGKLEIQATEDIPGIFSLAEQDTNEKLKLECVRSLRENLKPNNVVRLFHSAFNYKHQMFQQECGPLLQEHLSKIIVSDEYIELPEPVKLSLALIAALSRSSC